MENVKNYYVTFITPIHALSYFLMEKFKKGSGKNINPQVKSFN